MLSYDKNITRKFVNDATLKPGENPSVSLASKGNCYELPQLKTASTCSVLKKVNWFKFQPHSNTDNWFVLEKGMRMSFHINAATNRSFFI